MKKKKQSCAANRHKCRPVFLIEQELREKGFLGAA